MKPVLPLMLIASAMAFQAPKGSVAPLPEDAPISAGKSRGPGNELEGLHTSEDGVMSLGKYEGGSLAFKPNKIITYVNEKEVVIVQSKLRFGIPVGNIKQILYGNGVSSQVGQATGNAVLSAGMKSQSGGNLTIAGIVWTHDTTKNGVVLRMDKGDFDQFMTALQTVTGLRAASTDAK